jgi:hypothetical protein
MKLEAAQSIFYRPTMTLAIYAHMFHTDDSKAAVAINAALG